MQESAYTNLPVELKVIISSTLSWPEKARFCLADKALYATGWYLVSRINISDWAGDKPLRKFASLDFRGLTALTHLEIAVKSEQLANVIYPKLKDLSKLESLKLGRRSAGRSFRLPPSLQELRVYVTLSREMESSRIVQLCEDSPNLRRLELESPLRFQDVQNFSKLQNLEELKLPTVTGMSFNYFSECIPLLKSLSPALVASGNPLTIGALRLPGIFLGYHSKSLEFYRPFYDLGFRPDAVQTFRLLIQNDGGLAPEYVRQGWVDASQVQHELHRLVPQIHSEESFAIFVQLFTRLLDLNYPLAAKEPQFAGKPEEEVKSALAARMMKHRQTGMPLWIYGSAHFAKTLFLAPSQLHYKFEREILQHTCHWFAVNNTMERFFSLRGDPVDMSPERALLLQSMWEAVLDVSNEEGVSFEGGESFDEKFVFDKLWAIPAHFDKYCTSIIDLVCDTKEFSDTLDYVIGRIITSTGPRRYTAADHLFAVCEPDRLEMLITNSYGNMREDALYLALELGAGPVLEAFAEKDGHAVWNVAFPTGEISLHPFLRHAPDHMESITMLVRSLIAFEEEDDGEENYFRSADKRGNYPIHNWVHLLFTKPKSATAIGSLIAHFARKSDGEVDVRKTKVMALIEELNAKATRPVNPRLIAALQNKLGASASGNI